MIPIFVGFDSREEVAYHVFCRSVLARTREAVSFTPVRGEQRDASNNFSYARFLVPFMCDYTGWAIWADGDMVCRADIGELWAKRDSAKDVFVVKHDYQTKYPIKYLGQKNEDYPRKNWSSLMLIHCAAPTWRKLTPAYVALAAGSHLHRFAFMPDAAIGELSPEWNWLVSEYDENPDAKIAHFTVGIPPFYPTCDYSAEWLREQDALLNCASTP